MLGVREDVKQDSVYETPAALDQVLSCSRADNFSTLCAAFPLSTACDVLQVPLDCYIDKEAKKNALKEAEQSWTFRSNVEAGEECWQDENPPCALCSGHRSGPAQDLQAVLADNHERTWGWALVLLSPSASTCHYVRDLLPARPDCCHGVLVSLHEILNLAT